jgi:hypothetical protein
MEYSPFLFFFLTLVSGNSPFAGEGMKANRKIYNSQPDEEGEGS